MRIAESFSSGMNRISGWLGWVGFGLVLYITVIMLGEIFIRYFLIQFRDALQFCYESPLLGQVFLAMLAVSYVLREEGHIHIELVVDKLKPKMKNWVFAITSAISAVVCAFMVYGFWRFTQVAIRMGELTETVGLPMAAIKFTCCIGFGLFCFQFIARSYKYCRLARGYEGGTE